LNDEGLAPAAWIHAEKDKKQAGAEEKDAFLEFPS
jgi:hypothetical protein